MRKAIPDWLEAAFVQPVELLSTDGDSTLDSLIARAEAAICLYRYRDARTLATTIAAHPERLDERYRCMLLSLTARLQFAVGRFDDAFRTFDEACNCAEQKPEFPLLALQWATTLERNANYAEALDYLSSALRTIESSDEVALALIRTGIAKIQVVLDDPQTAIETLRCDTFDDFENIFARARLLITAADAFLAMNDIEQAIELLQGVQSHTNSFLSNERELLLATAYIARNDWDDAGSIAEAVAMRCEEQHLPYHAAHARLLYGQVFAEKTSPYYSPPLAIEHFKRALDNIAPISRSELAGRIYRQIATMYRTIGHHEKALQYMQAYLEHVERLHSPLTMLRIKRTEIEIARRNFEIERAQLREHQHSLESKLRQAEQTVAHVREQMEEQIAYLGTVAHDLKNPIAAIMMSAAIIERYGHKLSKADLDKHVSSIKQTAEWMKELVTGLLDFAALTTGKIKLTIEPVHTALLFDVVIEAYRLKALAKSLTVIKEYSDDDLYVLADSKRLQECLDNLLSNAIKYSPLGRNIYCRIEQHGETIRLSIRDEGPGLSEEEQRCLFQQFSRARSHDTGKEGGTGLGLSIVQRFVRAMNGTVGCESAIGKGSTFFVELPQAMPPSKNGYRHSEQPAHSVQASKP